MTEEEKAEEYADWFWGASSSERRAIKQAYLAGLKAGKDTKVEQLEKENAELKEKLDKIRKYLVYDIFDRFKYLEDLLKISQETQEELCKRIIEEQKTIGSLTDLIDELKAQIGKM